MFNHESNAAVELKSPKVGLVRVADFGACSGQRRPTQRLHPKPINFRRRQLKDGGWESRREDPSCTRVSFGPSVPNTARCTNIGFTGIDMYNVIMKTEHLHQLIWMSRPLMQAAEACVESGLVGTNLTVRMRRSGNTGQIRRTKRLRDRGKARNQPAICPDHVQRNTRVRSY